MSNTYARIKKEVVGTDFNDMPYNTKMELSLTAFVGNPEIVQLTVQISSSLTSQNGVGYITLSEKEIDQLIFALLERKHRLISATGYEKSMLIPE